MSQDSNFEYAQKIVNEAKKKNGKTTEQLIEEQIERLRTLDIMAELSKMDNFDEITKHLSSDEQDRLEFEAEEMSEAYSGILNAVADVLKDPEAREQILDELKRRVG